jgi:hypothetical protein
MAKLTGPLGRNPFLDFPRTPGPLGVNDAAAPNSPAWLIGDTPGPLGEADWADPDHAADHRVLLAQTGPTLPIAEATPAEYVPDLGATQATLEMYDHYFAASSGPLLKSRIDDAAKEVDINPGLLAASMLAEDKGKYTRTSGEVEGWDIGTDDYKERKRELERKIPAARKIKPIRYESHQNENTRAISEVPVFHAKDAVLASAVYLKHGELKAREACTAMGASFDRLPVEERFALTRYAVNAGPGAVRGKIAEQLGMTQLRSGKYVENKNPRRFLQFKPWKLERGLEQFSRHHPQRAATAHAAQAIHLSQKIFKVNPLRADDSLLFVR